MRRAHLQHLGAVGRQGSGCHRTGENAGHVQHAHPGKRPIRRRQGLWKALAQGQDLQNRQTRNRRLLGVGQPLLGRAHEGRARACGDQRFFQLLALPVGDRLRHRWSIPRAAENIQGTLPMMGKVGVQLQPPSIPGGVKSGNVVPQRRRWRAVDAQMPLAAKSDSRGARVEAYLLHASSAQPPQLRRRQCRGADGGGGRLTDLERRRQNRIGAFDGDVLQRLAGTSGRLPELFENVHFDGPREEGPMSASPLPG